MIRFRFKNQAPLLAGIFGLTIGLGLSSTTSAATSVNFKFSDSFDKLYKGQKLNSASNSKLGASNVIWTDEANTSLVDLTDSATLAKPGFAGVKPITNPAVTANSARTGDCTTCALQFYYWSGINSWAEQRYSINTSSLGTKGLTEIWLQYDIFIPSNYFHRDVNPTSTNWVGGGEKLLSMYADEYSGTNPTLILGLNMERFSYSTGKPNTTNVGGSLQSGAFSVNRNGVREPFQMWPEEGKWVVDINVDRGTWQRRTIHVVMPTSASSNDGVVEFWIKRANGTVSKIIDVHDGWFYGGTQNYINGGYLLGWSNSGFDNDTYFLMDNVIVASNSSMVDGTALGQAPQKSPPAQVQGLEGIQINTSK